MFIKPLFIVHITEKAFLKVIATVAQKRITLVTKVGMAHAYQAFIKTPKFQVLEWINDALLYNNKETS